MDELEKSKVVSIVKLKKYVKGEKELGADQLNCFYYLFLFITGLVFSLIVSILHWNCV
jgi:hypothetical protein